MTSRTSSKGAEIFAEISPRELTEYFDDIENIIKRRRDIRRDQPVHLGEFLYSYLGEFPVWVRYETLEAANVDLRTRVDVAQVPARCCRSLHVARDCSSARGRAGTGRCCPAAAAVPADLSCCSGAADMPAAAAGVADAAVVVTCFHVSQFSTEELSTKLSEFVR